MACIMAMALVLVASSPTRAAESAAGLAPVSPYGSVYVDPAGLLLFGPTLGVEVGGLQGHLSGTFIFDGLAQGAARRNCLRCWFVKKQA